jgi:hypothetical protein
MRTHFETKINLTRINNKITKNIPVFVLEFPSTKNCVNQENKNLETLRNKIQLLKEFHKVG